MNTLRRRGKRWLYLFLIVVLLGAYGLWAAGRPLPLLQPTAATSTLDIPTTATQLNWPAGQAALGILGTSIALSHGTQMPVPTASTAKLVTALTVLGIKPLAPGEQGPTITLTASDVALYNSYLAQQGSVVQVTAGEQISEYQMLEAMLLPSANNMADSLAIWAFGSLPAYSQAANQYLDDESLVETHIGSDASGFLPSTTSTARDLVRIGELTMQNPVLAQIVSQPTASNIPVVNTVKNVNFLLGSNGVIGIKTGNTDQAGGVFISASRTTVNAKPVTIVTAYTAAPNLFDAVQNSLPLVQSAQANFKPVAIARAGKVIGHYRQPWGGNLPVAVRQNLTATTWSGNAAQATIHLVPVPATAQAGQTVGSLTLPKSTLTDPQSIPLTLQATPTKPTFWWRLLHPLG